MTGPNTSDVLNPPGQREKNKALKLKRIKKAARTLFAELGFDETTTREIARRAGVGMGTIFLYADNKRDLLFLIANDDLADVIQSVANDKLANKPPLDALLIIFGDHYKYFAQQPALSRAMLREMTFYDSGKQGRNFQKIRKMLMDQISAVFAAGQAAGTIRKDVSCDYLGWLAFSIYQVELRRWIMGKKQNLTEGKRQLRKALGILFSGSAVNPIDV